MLQRQKKINRETKEKISKLLTEFEHNDIREYMERFMREYAELGDSKVYGGKHCGSDAEQQGARFIYEKLQELGLKAELLPFQTTRFQFNDADISYQGQSSGIKPYACLSVPTDEAGITGVLIDVENGQKEFYEEHDVTGKIVLIETKEDFEAGTIVGAFQMYEAEKNGAAAIILYTNEYIYDNETIRATYGITKCSIPVVTVCSKDAELLKAEMDKDPDFQITLTVDAEYMTDGGTSYEVVGEIEGRSDERIIYSAHLDHFFRSVQDNISACATLLGIAKAMKNAGYTPNRTITFVFSGSHEIGRPDSAAPDLLGAWMLLDELKKEWAGKIMADINFEYTALRTKRLNAFTSYEMKDMYLDFLGYMPESMPGFEEIGQDVKLDDYYLLTWCDACTFLMKGVPVFMNESVYEQIYEGTSPYIGRDHTNKDNFDTYDADTHLGCTAWYGALGIYLDNQDIIVPDYLNRCERLRLDDEEKAFLDKEGISYEAYSRRLNAFEEYAKAAKTLMEAYNESENITAEKSAHINSINMKLQQKLGKYTDGLTTSVPSMIQIPHKVYIEKGMLLAGGAETMKNEGWDTAYEKSLKKIDMAGLGTKYSDDLALKLKSWILGENATWNAGKCKNVFLYEDITPDMLEVSRQINIDAIRETLEEETGCFEDACDILFEIIFALSAHACEDEMMEWIEGFTKFPHRRTGTKEGYLSAEYVREVFASIGLSNVEIESVPSVGMDCTKYQLEVEGEEIKCFFANGTNRRGDTGTFVSDIDGTEIVYLGRGSEKDFQETDVKDRLVICDVYFKTSHPMEMLDWCEGAEIYDPHGKASKPLKKYDIYTPNDWPYNYLRAEKNGAAGFIGILHDFMDEHYFHEDYSDIVDTGGYMELPAVWISERDGEKIKALAEESHVKGSMHVHTVYEECEAKIIKGEIKGESDDIIVVHSHHDAVNAGAVQDASGMSEVFALADYFSRLPKELIGKTLMFVSTDSHYTDYEGHVGFLKNRKRNGERIIADFAIEHVAEEMDLDEENNIIMTGEPETRIFYVDERNGLVDLARKSLKKFDLEKTVLMPVTAKSSGEFTSDDVCSDAYDFNAAGIPVVSMLSAPMYLFHDSDDIDKVHRESLVKIMELYAYMIMETMQQ